MSVILKNSYAQIYQIIILAKYFFNSNYFVAWQLEVNFQDLWKVKVKVAQSCPTLWDPMDYIVHGILQTRTLEWIAFPFSRGSSQPRDWTQVSCIATGFLTSWATREAQEYWSGYLFLLQWIFPTQELNQGLLHCRQILYELSYEGSP